MSITSKIARKAGGVAGQRLIEELSVRLAGVTRAAVEQVVRTRGRAIAADADAFRLAHPDLRGSALDRALIRERSRRMGQAGLVTGLPSFVPVVGTSVELAAGVADAAALTYAQVSMVVALAHLHGRDVREIEPRRLDVLMVLGIDADIVRRDGDVLEAEGHTISLDALNRGELPEAVVARLNRTIGDRIVKRIANRRAKTTLARLLPFGLGVVVAAGTDYRDASAVGKAAMTYFDWLRSARPVVDAASH